MAINLKTYTLRQANITIFNKCKSLPSLQRRAAFGRLDKVKFIRSLIEKNVRTAIVVADVQKCLEHARSLENPCQNSIEVFERLLGENKLYLSVDGQNRTLSLEEFYTNTWGVWKATYNPGAGGEKVKIETETVYSQLPTDVKAYLDHSNCVSIDIIEDQTIDQIHNTYLALNSGVEHNLMERINASTMQASQVVRDLSSKGKNMWPAVSKLQYRRMEDIKYVAQAILMCIGDNVGSNDAKPTQIVTLYEQSGQPIDEGTIKLMGDIFYDMNLGIGSNYTVGKVKMSLAQWWGIFMSMHHIYTQKQPIWVDRSKFVDEIKRIVTQEVDAAQAKRGRDITAYHKNPTLVKPSKSQYFDGWISAFHLGPNRQKAYDKLKEHVDDILHNRPDIVFFRSEEQDIEDAA